MRFFHISTMAIVLAVSACGGNSPTSIQPSQIFPLLELGSESQGQVIIAPPNPECFLAKGGDGKYTWTVDDGGRGGILSPTTGSRACYQILAYVQRVIITVASGDGQQAHITTVYFP